MLREHGYIKNGKSGFDTVTYKIKKIKLRSFKSSEHIYEKEDGPYCGFSTQTPRGKRDNKKITSNVTYEEQHD